MNIDLIAQILHKQGYYEELSELIFARASMSIWINTFYWHSCIFQDLDTEEVDFDYYPPFLASALERKDYLVAKKIILKIVSAAKDDNGANSYCARHDIPELYTCNAAEADEAGRIEAVIQQNWEIIDIILKNNPSLCDNCFFSDPDSGTFIDFLEVYMGGYKKEPMALLANMAVNDFSDLELRLSIAKKEKSQCVDEFKWVWHDRCDEEREIYDFKEGAISLVDELTYISENLPKYPDLVRLYNIYTKYAKNADNFMKFIGADYLSDNFSQRRYSFFPFCTNNVFDCY